MNEVMKNILTRRSTRKFTDEKISKDILKDIVDAALHAPSGMGKQSWSFTVVTNKDVIAQLCEVVGAALGREHYDTISSLWNSILMRSLISQNYGISWICQLRIILQVWRHDWGLQ